MGLLSRNAWVAVSGTVADINIFVRSGWVGISSDRNAGPTVVMAHHIGNADILKSTAFGHRVDKDPVFAEAAYIKTVDQNVAVLPLGRHLNPNAAGLIVLSAAPNYSKITKPNLTTIGDNNPWAIAGIDGRGFLGV
jgi:hypothetical protein